MLSLAKRLQTLKPFLVRGPHHLRNARTDTGHSRRRPKSPLLALKKPEEKSEWWAVDGEMHEIGDNVPLRERFVIPRENIPNKRRKQLREQFMRRTRLVLKESVGFSLFHSLSSRSLSSIFLIFIFVLVYTAFLPFCLSVRNFSWLLVQILRFI